MLQVNANSGTLFVSGLSHRTAPIELREQLAVVVLHAPTAKLREFSRNGHGPQWVRFVTEIFGLDAARGGSP